MATAPSPRAASRDVGPDIADFRTSESRQGQRIDCADQPIRHIHFINRGLVCIAKTLEDGRTVEIGAIGIEGVANLLPFVGIHKTILDVVVQIPGTALRMGCDAMRLSLRMTTPIARWCRITCASA